MKFYCVQIEFYDNCKPKAAVVKTKDANNKPRDRRVLNKYGVVGYSIWLKDKSEANQLAKQVCNEYFKLNDIDNIYLCNFVFIEEVAA